MKNPSKIIAKYLEGTISESEREALIIWVRKSEKNKLFFKEQIKARKEEPIPSFNTDIAFNRFEQSISKSKQKYRFTKQLLKIAAVITLLVGSAILAKFYLSADTPVATKTITLLPDNNTSNADKITITLADGSTQIIGDTAENSVTDTNGNIIAKQKNGSLSYDREIESLAKEPIYNEIYIPNGQQFKLKLSDGSIVWLNSGSKLRFPQNFLKSSTNRTVYLEGEAFFDVTSNKEQPFIVNSQNINVTVLGTRFNVSSYANDGAIATTLVEGAVNVSEENAPQNTLALAPSYQARFNKTELSFTKTMVNTYIYTAWMQNKLYIEDLKFSEILKKLERAHNVTFINNYPDLDKEVYQGEFANESLDAILKTIALSTPFEYHINQNVITITAPAP